MFRRLVLALMLPLASACTTTPEILQIRDLHRVPDFHAAKVSNGFVSGIERTASRDGTMQANVVVVHGIGWTQATSKEPFAFDFIQAVRAFYQMPNAKVSAEALCPRTKFSDIGEEPKVDFVKTPKVGGLRIFSESLSAGLYGDDPRSRMLSTASACMDRIVIDLGTRGTVTVFRVLMDDLLYDAYEYPHIGFDDFGYADSKAAFDESKYQNIAQLRASYNRKLKDGLVNYGLTDAAMYMGPVGAAMRDAVAGALCAATSERITQESYFGPTTSDYVDRTRGNLCAAGAVTAPIPLAILTHSLGSRVVFDTLTRDEDGTVIKRLNAAKSGTLEVYLQANQIPMLGLSKLRVLPPKESEKVKDMRFVALSEVNDLLTYELVPYFEHLYNVRCRKPDMTLPDMAKECLVATISARQDQLLDPRSDVRDTIVERLGFEVVDIRLKFASPLFHIVIPFADPEEAHGDHLKMHVVQQALFCGVDDGNVRAKGNTCTK